MMLSVAVTEPMFLDGNDHSFVASVLLRMLQRLTPLAPSLTANFRQSFAQQVEQSGFLEQLVGVLNDYLTQMRAGSMSGPSNIVTDLVVVVTHLCVVMTLPPSAEALLSPLWQLLLALALCPTGPQPGLGSLYAAHLAVLDSVSSSGTEGIVLQHLRQQLAAVTPDSPLPAAARLHVPPDAGVVLSRVCCTLLIRGQQLPDSIVVELLLEWAADCAGDLTLAMEAAHALALGLTACQATASAWAADVLPALVHLMGRDGIMGREDVACIVRLLCDVCLPHVTAQQQRRQSTALLRRLETFVRAAAATAGEGALPMETMHALWSVSGALGFQRVYVHSDRLQYACGLAASMLKVSSIAGAVRVSDVCMWLGGMLQRQQVRDSDHKSACVMLLGRCVSLLEGNGPLLQQQIGVLREVMPVGGPDSRSVQQLINASFESCASWAICNNPSCSNLSGSSERAMVSGKHTKCGRCLAARYCSVDCQWEHWQQGHKHWCEQHAAV